MSWSKNTVNKKEHTFMFHCFAQNLKEIGHHIYRIWQSDLDANSNYEFHKNDIRFIMLYFMETFNGVKISSI